MFFSSSSVIGMYISILSSKPLIYQFFKLFLLLFNFIVYFISFHVCCVSTMCMYNIIDRQSFYPKTSFTINTVLRIMLYIMHACVSIHLLLIVYCVSLVWFLHFVDLLFSWIFFFCRFSLLLSYFFFFFILNFC